MARQAAAPGVALARNQAERPERPGCHACCRSPGGARGGSDVAGVGPRGDCHAGLLASTTGLLASATGLPQRPGALAASLVPPAKRGCRLPAGGISTCR